MSTPTTAVEFKYEPTEGVMSAQPLDALTLEKVDRAYDSPAWWYDLRGFLILCFSYRSTLWAQVAFFGANLGRRHLEGAIGSATLFSIILAWRRLTGQATPAHTVGFDYAEAMLAGARARFAGRDDVLLQRADVARLDHADGVFDTANIANAVHCFPDVRAGLREVARVLKPGGTLALNALLVPRGPAPLRWIAQRINTWGMRKGILHQAFEERDVRAALAAAGLVVERATVSGNTLNVLARKEG